MVTPDAERLDVRIDHNLGKIHDAAEARLSSAGPPPTAEEAHRNVAILGRTFRKEGLGKDVTDKFLAGLPACRRKAATASRQRALHPTGCRRRPHRVPRVPRAGARFDTGDRRDRATRRAAGRRHPGGLASRRALRDMVGYATKAKRHGRPKMVLIGDIVGENDDDVARAASAVIRLANARGAEGFVAVSADARKKFWLDRSRTAAIARHTNAFKINEDVVTRSPPRRFTDGVERINIELAREQAGARAATAGFAAPTLAHLWGPDAARVPRRSWSTKGGQALALGAVRKRGRTSPTTSTRRFRRCRTVRSSCRKPSCVRRSPRSSPAARSRGAGARRHAAQGDPARPRVHRAAHARGRRNVHTNLPVNLDDYAMLQTANAAVARIMALARSRRRRRLGRARYRHPKLISADAGSHPSPTTSAASIRTAASTGVSWCGRPRSSRTPTRRRSR
jgi:FAD/FMN-containing dehydrogenase